MYKFNPTFDQENKCTADVEDVPQMWSSPNFPGEVELGKAPDSNEEEEKHWFYEKHFLGSKNLKSCD